MTKKKQPFGVTAITLPKDEHGLKKDGVIYIRRTMTVGQIVDIQNIGEDPDTKDVLKMFIAGWELVDDAGIELPYDEDAIDLLPISVLEAITPHLDSHPLVQTSAATKTD